MFAVGDVKTFKAYSPREPMARFNGQRCTILSVIAEASPYHQNSKTMYSAEFENGETRPVFEDELTD